MAKKCKKGFERIGNRCVKKVESAIENVNMSHNHTIGGIGFFGLLTLIFITLKLTNYINWSWWWVLAPLWIPFIVYIIIFIVFIFIFKFLD